jgi:hypothetical protein
MKQIIPLVQRQIAALLFRWPEARVVKTELAGVGLQQLAYKLDHLVGVTPQGFVHASLVARLSVITAHLVFGWPVRDVFMQAGLGLALGCEKLRPFLKMEGSIPE